jgi:hypothetical protein
MHAQGATVAEIQNEIDRKFGSWSPFFRNSYSRAMVQKIWVAANLTSRNFYNLLEL